MSTSINALKIEESSDTSVIQRMLTTEATLAPLALRVPAGIIFAAHGAQKLFGAFDGYGLEGTGQFFETIGLTPGYLMALLAGGAEFFGGLALILGLLVRPSAAVLAFTMLIAIVTVHWDKGLFIANNGYEFGLALLAISVALVFSGAGSFSVDQTLSRSSR